MHEFELAKDKIMMGTERKSMVMSEKELEMTAYHEAGHAIIGRIVPEVEVLQGAGRTVLDFSHLTNS